MRCLYDIRAINASAAQGDTAKIASLRAAASNAFSAWIKDPLNPDLTAKKQQADDALAKEIMRASKNTNRTN
jgi:macrodomain Ter protein organizer (MatP/YcbG family)